MNSPRTNDTDVLLQQIQSGDQSAVQILLDRHVPRLKRMVAARMDPRVRARADASDVVQDALLTAHERLDEYILKRPIEFYPWLRRIAWQRLVDLQRRHIGAARRAVGRETTPVSVSDESALAIVSNVATAESGPLQRIAKRELQQRVRTALELLPEHDCEVLLLRVLEQMSVRETAQSLHISEGAVKTRQVRALQRIRKLLSDEETNA